jgi:ankyrin repeat protein
MTEPGSSHRNAPDGSDPVELAHWLFDRARAGESDVLGAYLDAGVPQDLTDNSGNTLLMLAAYHGHPDAVTTLVRHGATVDAINDRGQSPLAGAVFLGHRQVATVLLEHGADPHAGTPSAWAAAYYFEQSDMIDLLTAAVQQPSDPDRGT